MSLDPLYRVLTKAEIISPEAQHKTIKLYNERMKKAIKEGTTTEKQTKLYKERQELEKQKYIRKSTLHYNFGEQVQMDAAFSIWFGEIVTALHLAVDKATKKVLYGWFDYQETTRAYFVLLMNIIINYGIPEGIRTDKRRSFSINAKLINSKIKGRLRAEMKHNNIKDMESANKFLNDIFIPKMNDKFSYDIDINKNNIRKNNYTKEELNIIISEKYERLIDNASSIKYKTDYYVLVDNDTGEVVSYPNKTKCTIIIAYDGTYWGEIDNIIYSLVKIEKPEKEIKVPKERNYFQGRKPTSNHPWAYHKRN